METIHNVATAAHDLALPFGSIITESIRSAVATAAPNALLAKAVDGDTPSLISLGRALAQQEGYLVQKAIANLLSAASDRMSLSNLRIPVLDSALDLVSLNKSGSYSQIALDSEAKSRRSYCADIVLIDREKRHAWVLDVKRSLVGYDSKLTELLIRMQAAGLVLPDLLWREHHRLAVDSVGVAIIDASSERHKPESGLWALAEIDGLFGLTGFAEQCRRVTEAYREAVQRAWRIELEQAWTKISIQGPSAAPADEMSESRQDTPENSRPVRRLNAIHIGLARPKPHPASAF